MIGLEEFRTRCRTFLDTPVEDLGDTWATGIAFQRKLYDAGLAGVTVPEDYGGQGLSGEHQEVLATEADGLTLPTGVFTITIGMCVPVLLQHGTEEQKRRHVGPMLRGEEIWCQLFSEPNAGSDVAAAQLRAVPDGDEWVLTGQKVWTSSAERSPFGMCIARTHPELPKHRGLTMFVVPMDTSGVTIRPLVQATGDSGFNEVFFDEARVPADSVIGETGQGWAVTISMLMNERVSLGASANSLVSGSTTVVFEAARSLGGDRQVLADLHAREELQRYVALRVRSAVDSGREPGPAGSIAKLAGSDLVRRAATAHLHLRGPGGAAWLPDDAPAAEAVHAFVQAPSMAIAGGTSEIQRTIIGERVLGLPKEPEVDKGVPFRDVRQNDAPA